MTTTTFTPLDEAARLRIRESLDENLFVEAGAGTGKTTSLVDRVVGLPVPVTAPHLRPGGAGRVGRTSSNSGSLLVCH